MRDTKFVEADVLFPDDPVTHDCGPLARCATLRSGGRPRRSRPSGAVMPGRPTSTACGRMEA
eukprot:41550-Chlamydomonas_euryale.AAC.1